MLNTDKKVGLEKRQRANGQQAEQAFGLTEAFRLMRKRGLLARQNFSCCQNCGCSEMDTMKKEGTPEQRSAIGYAFYHQQDNENKENGQDFYIAYGVFGDAADGAAAAIGQIVTFCLNAAGVVFEWDGNPSTRILVVQEEAAVSV